MSLCFKPEQSTYLRRTAADLAALRSNSGAPSEELYACSPLTQEMRDTRTIDELKSTIDIIKLQKQIDSHPTGAVIWVGICCGSFAPIHNSHVQMGKKAIDVLQKRGENVAMVYYIPNNSSYTILKLKKRGDPIPEYLQSKHIEGSLKATFSGEPQLDACLTDLYRVSYCEWFVCAQELMNMIRHFFPKVNFKFAIIGGEDLVRSPGQLFKGTSVIDFANLIMMVPRGMEEEKRKKYPLANDVIVLDEADTNLSSTKVRKCLTEKNFSELEKDLHPNTLNYLKGVL